MGEKQAKTDYSKNVVRLGLVSFFTDVSTEMVLGILPLFIIGELGASKAILGIIEGFGELVSYLSRTLSGALSDKIGKRKLFVLAGYSLSTISKPFFALSTIWTHALVVRAADRFGKGIRTAPRDALLSDSVEETRVGKAFGTHRSLDQAGAIVGPLLAFALIPLIGIRGIFGVSFIPGTIAVLILLLLVRERKVHKNVTLLSNFSSVLRGRFLLLLIILTVFSLGAFNFSFMLLQGMELGVTSSLIPIMFVIINLTHTAVGYPSGMLSDKIGGEKTLIFSYALFFIVSFVGITSPSQAYIVFIMAGVFGLYLGISETVQRAVIPKYVSSDLRGTAYGVYYLFVGVSSLIANTVFGTLWELAGVRSAFTYSLMLSAVAIIALAMFLVKRSD